MSGMKMSNIFIKCHAPDMLVRKINSVHAVRPAG